MKHIEAVNYLRIGCVVIRYVEFRRIIAQHCELAFQNYSKPGKPRSKGLK